MGDFFLTLTNTTIMFLTILSIRTAVVGGLVFIFILSRYAKILRTKVIVHNETEDEIKYRLEIDEKNYKIKPGATQTHTYDDVDELYPGEDQLN